MARRAQYLLTDADVDRIAREYAPAILDRLRMIQGEPEPTTFIYALRDPDTLEVRYIGRAVDPETRFLAHLTRDRRTPFPSCKERWIAELQRVGKEPALTVLAEVPVRSQRAAEVYWIELARADGNRLTNTAKP